MNRQDLAHRKREIRAKRRRFEALAGGWGRPAQTAAWDLVFPRWRACLRAITNIKDLAAEPAPREVIEQLSATLTAGARPCLSKPWYRLLMQTMQRHHDEQRFTRFERWGGYPL